MLCKVLNLKPSLFLHVEGEERTSTGIIARSQLSKPTEKPTTQGLEVQRVEAETAARNRVAEVQSRQKPVTGQEAEVQRVEIQTIQANRVAEPVRTVPQPMQTRSMYSPPTRIVQMQPANVEGQPALSDMLRNAVVVPLVHGVSATSSFENIERAALKKPLETKPFAVIGGVLSVPEGLTYSVLNLIKVPTRNMPSPPSLSEPAYSLGWGAGELLTTMTVTYVGGKVLTGIAEVGQWIGSKLEEKTQIMQRIKLSPVGEWYYGTKEQVPTNPLKFKGSGAEDFLARQSEGYRDFVEKQLSSGIVDEPLATSLPSEGVSTITSDFLKSVMPEKYAEGFEYAPDLTMAEREAVDLSKTIGIEKTKGAFDPYKQFMPRAMETEPLAKASDLLEIGKATPKLPDVPEHLNWKFPLSLAEQAEPLKLVGEQDILETPESIRAIQTAEKLGLGIPHTAMIDPFNAELIEVPTLERPIAGVPFMPKPEVTARVMAISTSFLPKFVSASAFLGFQAFQVTKPTVKSQPALTPLAKLSNILDQPSRTDLIVSPDVAQILEPMQMQKLEPLLKAVQILKPISILKPVSLTKIVSPTPLVYRMKFTKDFTFKQDFKTGKRKKRKRGTGLYVWEFPILDPEKVLQMT